MRWKGGRQSTNVEDRRGIGRGGMAVGGGLGAIVITVLALLFGVDPSALLDQTGGGGGGPAPGAETRRGPAAPDDELGQFVRVVLGTTEDTWNEIFRQQGSRYREPTLVLFSGQVNSACGRATASVGPFYCSGDEKLYIDLTFYRELKERFRAPGDFAQAYVIAHEVGHHIQHLTGAMEKVSAAQRRMSQAEGNRLSVRLELQADCYSGIWARHADQRGAVEPGDIEEALQAASAIGDDRLQKQSQGHVVPDSFTHGTSEQRARWFRVGYESGDVRRCDTFAARSL
ncbi:MAG TPA: neutral zinc metallopeptidase [Pyrinomonadaceae bacterium]|nr:neutral zinc metallopeptidase [Pyrinomonadaceae bacterium]